MQFFCWYLWNVNYGTESLLHIVCIVYAAKSINNATFRRFMLHVMYLGHKDNTCTEHKHRIRRNLNDVKTFHDACNSWRRWSYTMIGIASCQQDARRISQRWNAFFLLLERELWNRGCCWYLWSLNYGTGNLLHNNATYSPFYVACNVPLT